jgi:mono/diheme cytochrome c family protein
MLGLPWHGWRRQDRQGPQTEGDSRPRNRAKMSASEMIKIVENGKGSDMDAYGKELNQDQIKAVVDYFRSLAK